ncbi:MAG: hypothetical protein IKU78_00980 [Paludibacteraceae bacterium]|nr:hypothetical protein [Paludibacteraceae bacterium]
MKKESIIITIASVVIALLIIALFIVFRNAKNTEKEMQEMVEQINYEKEALEEEYSDLAFFEGFNHTLQNDSILKLLDTEKQRVQLLLEELRQTKATNARRISELKKELASVRKIMISYVNQIDSLNKINTHLMRENTDIKNRYTEATQTVATLSQEKEDLTEKVKLASMLEVRDIVVTTLNERERATSRLRKIALIKFDFVVLKNITTPTGNKIVYLRIITPDERILNKRETDVFEFEGSNIKFSCKKQFEYMGEEVAETLYWSVEEVLIEGTYRVDIFIDGNLVGSQTFVLK